jgi:hypothetical protein
MVDKLFDIVEFDIPFNHAPKRSFIQIQVKPNSVSISVHETILL